jgi:uncharacterized protein (TIGR00297 family)
VPLQTLVFLTIVFLGVFCSIWFKKLTAAGGIAGGIAGLCLYLGGGWTGFLLMAFFFVLGTAATSWKRSQKQLLRTAEEHTGKRTVSQVLANGGVGGLLGLLAWWFPQQKDIFQLMIAAAFSSATADTVSSELGSVYGKKFYNILSFKNDKKGLDGVVSLEGTLFGVAGSLVIAVIYSMGFGWSINFIWIVIAGTIGNVVDSLLGAMFERKGLLNNDLVNFFNTLAAVLVCLLVGFH